jgi:uncharacterized protein with FMN-binding domain
VKFKTGWILALVTSALLSPEGGRSVPPRKADTGFRLKDGLYAGESPGWTGMKVSVRVRKGRIHSLEVLEARGTPRFVRTVLDSLPARICAAGSLDVDAVSGATLSSKSLIEAARGALEKAKASERPPGVKSP